MSGILPYRGLAPGKAGERRVRVTTGKEVLECAMRLLGYTNHLGDLDNVRDAELFKLGAAAVTQIYNDLRRLDRAGNPQTALEHMTDPIGLSPVTIDDIMPYGVAMLIAQNEGDGDSQALFAGLYNQKRSSVPQCARSIRNIWRKGECV